MVRKDGDLHDDTPSVAEISFLLLALSNLPENDPRRSLMKDIAATLWQSIELPHGRIATHISADDPSRMLFRTTFRARCFSLAVACEENASEDPRENDYGEVLNTTGIAFVISDTSGRSRGCCGV